MVICGHRGTAENEIGLFIGRATREHEIGHDGEEKKKHRGSSAAATVWPAALLHDGEVGATKLLPVGIGQEVMTLAKK